MEWLGTYIKLFFLNNQYCFASFITKYRPYMMDLGSTNGTQVNKTKMHTKEYYELKNYDMINFGMSTRDYILIKGDNIDYKKLNIK